MRAKKFILEDATGKERGVLSVNDKGAELKLLGSDGKPRVALYTDDTGQGLCLSDANGQSGL